MCHVLITLRTTPELTIENSPQKKKVATTIDELMTIDTPARRSKKLSEILTTANNMQSDAKHDILPLAFCEHNDGRNLQESTAKMHR